MAVPHLTNCGPLPKFPLGAGFKHGNLHTHQIMPVPFPLHVQYVVWGPRSAQLQITLTRVRERLNAV